MSALPSIATIARTSPDGSFVPNPTTASSDSAPPRVNRGAWGSRETARTGFIEPALVSNLTKCVLSPTPEQGGSHITWTYTNLVIQIIAGVLGGYAAATAAHEHSFGAFGHTLVGALGGAASGYFLQKLAGTVVTASGSLNEPTAVENGILQGLAGAVSGGILVLAVGFLKHSIDHHKNSR